MSDLLADVIEAHGGLDRWRSVSLGQATIVTGGGLWGLKGLIQDTNPRRMTVSLHEERASLKPFGDFDWHTEFTPERIAIVRGDGSVANERLHPRSSFAGHGLDTPWDPLHRAYFNGYAMWTYLTTPFLFTMEGVQAQEVEPSAEENRPARSAWCFRDSIATHSPVQDFYSGDDLFLVGMTTMLTSLVGLPRRNSFMTTSRPMEFASPASGAPICAGPTIDQSGGPAGLDRHRRSAVHLGASGQPGCLEARPRSCFSTLVAK